jgi:hypothetical protein
MLKLFIHSRTNESNIHTTIGQADYSYYYVRKLFEPALRRIGEVIIVNDPDNDLEALLANASAAGDVCLFFSFTPPHKMWRTSSCPCIPVFAWEYGTIPNEPWGDNRNNDWTDILRHCGHAITLSTYARDVTREAISCSFNVIAAPSPLWDSMQEPTPLNPAHQPDETVEFTFSGHVLECSRTGAANAEAVEEQLEKTLSNSQTTSTLTLGGVIYTSVFNPADGRKNWKDLVHTFCWAFRDKENATLLLKLAHHDPAFALREVWREVERVQGKACRVILLHGYLDQQGYRALISASHYVLNSSYGEGQCLPLTEFMACGRPAIAPLHTAMRDYLDDNTGFPFGCSLEWTHWPHDFRAMKRTYRYRIDCEDMIRALKDSHAVSTTDWHRYMSLGQQARARTEAYCSLDTVTDTLGKFVDHVQKVWPGTHLPDGTDVSDKTMTPRQALRRIIALLKTLRARALRAITRH